MNRFLLFLALFASVSSCISPKKPVFKYVDMIKIEKIGLREVTVKANAVFENPNALNGTLSIDDIHIVVNSIDVGTVSSEIFKVPQQNNFTIPLKGTFSLSKIYENDKNNLLNSILRTIQTDSIQIQYKGAIKYHLGDFKYPYKINKKEYISLK